MKDKKIILNKKQLNEIENFMTKNDIQEYHHQQDKLSITIKHPKESDSHIPKKLFFIWLVGIGLCIVYPNVMEDFYNFRLWTNAITVLICIGAYKVIEMVHSFFVKKEKLIMICNETKKTKDYYDSTKQK